MTARRPPPTARRGARLRRRECTLGTFQKWNTYHNPDHAVAPTTMNSGIGEACLVHRAASASAQPPRLCAHERAASCVDAPGTQAPPSSIPSIVRPLCGARVPSPNPIRVASHARGACRARFRPCCMRGMLRYVCYRGIHHTGDQGRPDNVKKHVASCGTSISGAIPAVLVFDAAICCTDAQCGTWSPRVSRLRSALSSTGSRGRLFCAWLHTPQVRCAHRAPRGSSPGRRLRPGAFRRGNRALIVRATTC